MRLTKKDLYAKSDEPQDDLSRISDFMHDIRDTITDIAKMTGGNVASDNPLNQIVNKVDGLKKISSSVEGRAKKLKKYTGKKGSKIKDAIEYVDERFVE